MAVKIRLTRRGGKHKPFFRVVVADLRSPRDGRFIEVIGRYDPRKEPSFIEIDKEKALKWLKNGAQPSGTVAKLLKISGIKLETKPTFKKSKVKRRKTKPKETRATKPKKVEAAKIKKTRVTKAKKSSEKQARGGGKS